MMNMPTTSPSVLAAFASNLNFRICTLMCFLLFLLLLLLVNPPSSSSFIPGASIHVWLPLNVAIGSFEHDEVNEACNEEVVDTVGLPMWSDDGYEMDILIFSLPDGSSCNSSFSSLITIVVFTLSSFNEVANDLFIHFLAVLRDKYLNRKRIKTFHSIILAGVHDVKSLKLKIRP